jgi:hypothetical protein
VRSRRKANPFFPPPPAPPSSTTAFGGGGPLTLTLRGKAMDGFEAQQERTRPQLCPPSLENRRNGCRFSTSVNRPAALRRGPPARSLSSPRTEMTTRAPGSVIPQSHVSIPPYSNPQAVQKMGSTSGVDVLSASQIGDGADQVIELAAAAGAEVVGLSVLKAIAGTAATVD